MNKTLLLRLFVLGLVLTAVTGCVGMEKVATVRGSNPGSQRVQRVLDAAVREYKVPGAVLALRSPDGRTRTWASGKADLKTGKPMRAAMHFRIGSVTKTFTATLVMQLLDEGRLQLDDQIAKYLPGLVPNGEVLTIRDLLEMRSGLADYDTAKFEKELADDPDRDFTPAELVGFAKVEGKPGGNFAYRNVNFIILGMLIEKLTGDRFAEQVGKRILQPLAMKETTVPDGLGMPQPLMRGYVVEGGKPVDGTDSQPMSVVWSAGDMVSTVGDQLIWADALCEGRLLTPESHDQQFRTRLNESGYGVYAYGLGIMQLDGLIGHGGNFNDAYTCFVGRFRGYDIVIVANGQIGQAGEGVEKTSRCIGIFRRLVRSEVF